MTSFYFFYSAVVIMLFMLMILILIIVILMILVLMIVILMIFMLTTFRVNDVHVNDFHATDSRVIDFHFNEVHVHNNFHVQGHLRLISSTSNTFCRGSSSSCTISRTRSCMACTRPRQSEFIYFWL